MAIYRARLVNNVLTWLKVTEPYTPPSSGTGLATTTTLTTSPTLTTKG